MTPQISPLTMPKTQSLLTTWINGPKNPCRMIATCNLDHLCQLEHNTEFQDAYAAANLITPDGGPVRWLVGAPERVTGVDLTINLLKAGKGHGKLRVFLLGAAPGVARRAAETFDDSFPASMVVGYDSPPIGFENDRDECWRIINKINEVSPDLLVLGFGAPKQEVWLAGWKRFLNAKVAICAGGTIDFLAGEQKRVGSWGRVGGVEAFHRLCSDPRRLWDRYSGNLAAFPRLTWRYRIEPWMMRNQSVVEN